MNKKARNVLMLVILAIVCLFVFAACNKVPDINSYSESDLGIMGKLVRWMHSWIGNYGWTVVVFTVFLKILMLPFDFWQRYAARKSSLKMQQMQPIIEGIDKRYGANTQRANEEKQKLYKKQGFSMMSSCLPMIVSMVIFIIIFAGLRNYSAYSSIQNFKNLSNTYYETYAEQIADTEGEHYSVELKEAYDKAYTTAHDSAINDAQDDEYTAELKGKIAGILAAQEVNADACEHFKAAAIDAVKTYYENNHESWLWIENVWQPDTWASIMQPYEGGAFAGGGFSTTVNLEKYPDHTKGEDTYNIIRKAVLETGGHGKNGTWNGFMILPFLSIGLSFLSIFISQRMERKNRKGEVVQQNAQQATTNKMTMIMMPLIMAYCGFIYTGAFAIYMVVNYAMTILTIITMRWPVEKMVNRSFSKDDKKNKSGKATYMR
ncbi:MAG: membrane protein insertase YidC [Clostridiales bacterium]|nr:membrane protein insertase YidC [Clostridiales bacterium]